MFRLTIKNLWGSKIRFALTTFGVVLAVSFVVAAFVLGDGLRRSFTDVAQDVTAGVDLQVRSVSDFGDPPPLPASTVAAVRTIPGVADAEANIKSAPNAVRAIRANGKPVPTDGPPQLGFNWIDNPRMSPLRIVAGSPPGVGDFTMDVDSAAKYGFVIGDSYEFDTPEGRVQLRMSGTSSFGADNSTLGAVLMQMNTAEAGTLFGVAGIDNVSIEIADHADLHTVETAVAAAVPTAEVVDHATVLAETTNTFTSEIDLVGNILLGFGGLALFVSMFIIYNTFGIVMNQRTRELALLRTIGAEPRQIRRSVRAESFAIGALASAGGIAGGIGVAKGLDALFAASGAKLADYPLIVAPRTIIAAVAIGVGVTMLAAMGPARRAANTPPIVALTGAGEPKVGESRRRMVAGFGVLGAGILAGAAGLSGVGSTAVTVAALAAGAMAIFVGATLLSPLAVPAITTLFGLPMRAMAGVAATLAQKNANRHARRTATTAAALMIGLTLVTTALLVGSSIKSTFGAAISHASKADYIVSDELDDVDFPATLTQQLRDSDGVAAAAGFTSFQARIDGHVVDAVGVDFDQVGGLVDFGVRSGGFDATAINPVVVADHTAKARNAHVGDTIVIEVANGRKVDATITGTFHDQAVVSEDYLFDTSVLAAVGMDATPQWLAVSLVDGASRAQVDAFLASVTSEYPYATVETAAAFSKRIQGNIDQLLTMVNLLVALAVIIALIGIANTLALSVFERTRELGLIRAVGMSRRQLRRMVRLEAALVATFGATLGVGLGLLFGWGVIAALPSSLATVTSVPVQQILVLVLVAAGAGVTAAWLPARRAGRLDVLQAIAL